MGREVFEFRIPEDRAADFLPPNIGRRLGANPLSFGVRVVDVEARDPIYQQIGAIERSFRARGDVFFLSWNVRRRYDDGELNRADIFHLIPRFSFEPCGEQCGTAYDDTTACPICGAGRTQASDLVLDLRRRPAVEEFDVDLGRVRTGKDIGRTIANELIVSNRLARLLQTSDVSGVTTRPIRRWKAKNSISDDWRQLIITSTPVDVVAPSAFGSTPFDSDDEGRFRCPLGHVAGLNLLTELTVRRPEGALADVQMTRQHVGNRSGYLVPEPLVLVSRRVRSLLVEHRINGASVEVAHFR